MTQCKECKDNPKLTRSLIGKRNRAKGRRFEQRCDEFLRKQGWLLTKWSNNVDLTTKKIVPAKGNPFHVSTGFPDRFGINQDKKSEWYGNISFFEYKVNGYLDKIEVEKVKVLRKDWKFYVLCKGQKKGEILMKEIK